MLNKAHEVWKSGAMLRARRVRCRKFTFGDQWSDTVVMPDGKTMTERQFVRLGGYNPMTSNVIRSIVKSIVGYFRLNSGDRAVYSSMPPELKETDARTFEEFLVSGCAVQRLSRGRADGGAVQISPARFFIDSVADRPELLGVLHDISLSSLLMRFSHGDKARAQRLGGMFRRNSDPARMSVSGPSFGCSVNDSLDFLRCGQPDKCRVVELWTHECGEQLRCHDPESGRVYFVDTSRERSIRKENRSRRASSRPEVKIRWELCGYWRCRFLMPDGSVVDEYTAETHPFAFRFYPLIDGEIHSFVEDIIDQQRTINRLLTLNDRMVAVWAKGVLMFPDNQLSQSMPIEIVQENWAAPDGVVLYTSKPGLPGPQQVVSPGAKFGVDHLIDGQLKMLQEVSGVNGAMRGMDPASGTTASLYAGQQRGASVALSDLVGTFDAFLDLRDKMLMDMEADK